MAKLPARQKVIVLCFRRSDPDEILVVQREAKGVAQWGLPTGEVEGRSARDAALRLVSEFVRSEPIGDFDLGGASEYRVGAGPRAGEWTERFYAVEMPVGSRAVEGRWFAHYDAKTHAGADAPRVREAMTRLRELARLKP